MGDESKLIAAGTYLFPVLGGLLVFLLRKKPYERFHAVQSILFWIAVAVISIGLGIVDIMTGFIPLIGRIFDLITGVFSLVFSLVVLALWLVLMYKAFTGERWKLPLLGGIAEKHSS